MLNFIQPGQNIDVKVAPYAAASGTGMLVGAALFGVAVKDIANGGTGVIVTEGVVELSKVSALAITAGDRVFWDNSTKLVNKTATSNLNIGIAIEDAANPSATVKIKLQPVVPAGT